MHNRQTIDIPVIPQAIKLTDLDAKNNKLFSDEQIAEIFSAYRAGEIPEGRTTKLQLNAILQKRNPNLPKVMFSIERHNDTINGIYKGVKHNAHVGAGGFGSVKYEQNLKTGLWEDVIKVLKASKEEEIQREIKGLTLTNMLKALHPLRTNKDGEFRREIVMHRAQGVSLEEFTNSKTKLPTRDWLVLAENMLKAVKQLHDKQMIHGDIKPKNMNYDQRTGEVTVFDYGLSYYDVPNVNEGVHSLPGWGSENYLSPEAESDGIYSAKSDIYALGRSLAWTLGLAASSTHEFNLISDLEEPVFQYIFDKNTTISDATIRKEVLTLLEDMTKYHSSERCTLDEAMQRLAKIQLKNNELAPVTKEIGFINIEELNVALPEERDAILKAAEKFDKVYFVDQNATNKDMYAYLEYYFANHHIKVEAKVVQYQHDFKNELIQFSNQLASDTNANYNSQVINKNGLVENLTLAKPSFSKGNSTEELHKEYLALNENYNNLSNSTLSLTSATRAAEISSIFALQDQTWIPSKEYWEQRVKDLTPTSELDNIKTIISPLQVALETKEKDITLLQSKNGVAAKAFSEELTTKLGAIKTLRQQLEGAKTIDDFKQIIKSACEDSNLSESRSFLVGKSSISKELAIVKNKLEILSPEPAIAPRIQPG